ncbi:hypothetical protein [Streptomyces lavendulocolor]|uniref:hypothetical protein n=1 Tax=Streptomyces lavendulocolor TaxID=67316 RepID=UPI0033FA7BAB
MVTLPLAGLATAATAIGGAISTARYAVTKNFYEGSATHHTETHNPIRMISANSRCPPPGPDRQHHARGVLRSHPQRDPLTGSGQPTAHCPLPTHRPFTEGPEAGEASPARTASSTSSTAPGPQQVIFESKVAVSWAVVRRVIDVQRS